MMMRHYLLASLLATTIIYAHGHSDKEAINEKHLPWYIIAKGAMITGSRLSESEDVLDGRRGYGYGMDLGYHLSREFALEADFTYAVNDVDVEGEVKRDSYRYYFYVIDAVYTYEYSEDLGLFAKVGYEYEEEKVKSLAKTNYGAGLVWGIGLEYHLAGSYKTVIEYEHSTLEGPHGEYLFFGIMYGFELWRRSKFN